MCARVLASSPTPALTQKHVSTRLNKFQLGLQFVTKKNYSFLVGESSFGQTAYTCVLSANIQIQRDKDRLWKLCVLQNTPFQSQLCRLQAVHVSCVLRAASAAFKLSAEASLATAGLSHR
jgi:hypothetical protein